MIWNLHQDSVLKEIATLLNVEKATTTTTGWFPKRITAAGVVLEKMNAEQKAELATEVERIRNEGYPDEVKRRYVAPDRARRRRRVLIEFRLAEKYTGRRVQASAREQWLELGVMSVTLTAYYTREGQLVVDA